MRWERVPLLLLFVGLGQFVGLGHRVGLAQSLEEENGESIQATVPAEIKSSPQEQQQAAREISRLTNEFRDEQGVSPVTIQPKLTATAQYFADFMAAENKYGHTADGNRPSKRAKDHDYDYCIISENIAYQYSSAGFAPAELASRFTTGWENSPEHRKNMVDADVTETGVAVAQSEKTGYYFAVQMFGRPRSLQIEFTLLNRTATTIHYRSGDRELTLPPRYRRTHYVCRPQEITLFTVNEKEPEKERIVEKFKPVTESTYTITGEFGNLSVRAEKP